MDWGTKRALQSTAFVAVVAGGAWYGYKKMAPTGEGSSVARDECHERREKMRSVCIPQCDSNEGKNLLAAHDHHRKGTRDDCIDRCARDKFGMPMPVCKSRR